MSIDFTIIEVLVVNYIQYDSCDVYDQGRGLTKMAKVLVLGAGIQGTCCALALHQRGYDVTVIEKAKRIIDRTSLNQEGHVHLGFTYALDRTGRTGEMMLHSALKFASAMERWVGRIDWDSVLLDPCHYLIHKTDSLMPADEILAYYEGLQKAYNQLIGEEGNSYLGQKPKTIFKVLNRMPSSISGNKISHAVLTAERIIEIFTLRDIVVEVYERQGIKTLVNTEIRRVERSGRGFIVTVVDENHQEQRLKADIVVNCLWNNRIEIDRTLGIETVHDPFYRFKIGILGKVNVRVPNCTIVAGAFGNISPRLDGSYAYISWHTDCVMGMSTDGITPQSWEDYFTLDHTKELESEWVRNCIRHMSEIVPSVVEFKPIRLLPGVICSSGKTDIQDKNSTVHNRADQMGVFEFDHYYSINTGKFSSAPLLASDLIAKMEAAGT